jgi:tetratricopeptide (TPR) repeat protein
MMKRSVAAAERARSLDPNLIPANYVLVGTRVEGGELAAAYAEAEDLVRRRPESADAHYLLAYVFRYAGLLDDAASECEKTRSLDPHNRAWRSCYGVFTSRGDYGRALEFLRLEDPSSEYARAGLVLILLLQGKTREAAEAVIPGHSTWWASTRMAQACAAHRPLPEIVAMANALQGQDDPEASFFYSSYLAYCGQTDAALRWLKRAIAGNYCSYPAMDTIPFFASIRSNPEFAELRAAGKACQQRFGAERQRLEHTAK